MLCQEQVFDEYVTGLCLESWAISSKISPPSDVLMRTRRVVSEPNEVCTVTQH